MCGILMWSTYRQRSPYCKFSARNAFQVLDTLRFRLDSLERHEAGVLPDGYVVSRANSALVDFVQAMYAAVDALSVQGTLFC